MPLAAADTCKHATHFFRDSDRRHRGTPLFGRQAAFTFDENPTVGGSLDPLSTSSSTVVDNTQ